MSVQAIEEQDRGTRTTARGLLPRIVSLPRNYPVGWAIAWTVLLLSLTLAPRRILPDEKAFSTKSFFPRSDLAVHFTLFVGYAWSWIRATHSRWRWGVVAAVGLFLAIGTEWSQDTSFIDRDCNLSDGIADCTGVLVGLAAAAIFRNPPVPKPKVPKAERA